MTLRKNIISSFFLFSALATSIASFAEVAPKPVNIEAGGANFVIPACGGPLKVVEGKNPVFTTQSKDIDSTET